MTHFDNSNMHPRFPQNLLIVRFLNATPPEGQCAVTDSVKTVGKAVVLQLRNTLFSAKVNCMTLNESYLSLSYIIAMFLPYL